MDNANGGSGNDTKRAVVDAFAEFGGDALRDIWLFDQTRHEALHLRDDIRTKVERIDVATFINNERYGYVTRDTYGQLYYASYQYTVRGFGEYEQFRTFVPDGDEKIGIMGSFDQRDGGYDFESLNDSVVDIVTERPDGSLRPE